MPIRQLRGKREGRMERGEEYKSAVIDYFKSRGFYRVGDSFFDSSLSDLRFKRPSLEGNTEFLVEAKGGKLSLSDPNFISEFGRYFVAYFNMPEKRRFKFLVAVAKLSNISRWESVFESNKWDENEIEKVYNSIEENINDQTLQNFRNTSIDDFKEFLIDSRIIEGNYIDFKRKAEKIESEDDFEFDELYLKEEQPIEDQDTLLGNFKKVIRYPSRIYKVFHRENLRPEEFYDSVEGGYDLKYHRIFSVRDLENPRSEVKKFIANNSKVESEKFKEWMINKDNKYIASRLLKDFVSNEAEKRGAISANYRGKDIIFFPHDNDKKKKKMPGGWVVSKFFEDFQDGEGIYRHKALNINTRWYDGELYLFLNPIFVFTSDGKSLIKNGNYVDKLHNKLHPPYQGNDKIRSYCNFWSDFLRLEFGGVKGNKPFVLSEFDQENIGVRPYKNSKEQKEADQ